MQNGINEERRRLLRYGFYGMGLLAAGPLLYGCQVRCARQGSNGLGALGPLGDPDANGLRLPAGFSSRIVARSSQPVTGTQTVWHAAPDGGATFATDDGGWIYVSNSEINFSGGGVSALRFDAQGAITAAYPILTGTSRNCAGGPTSWGTWLSCEEVERGRVWECDPSGVTPAQVLPALGVFMHEAVAVDPVRKHLYLTEDDASGRLYRFTPQDWTGERPLLADGVLEVAVVTNGRVTWRPVPDPQFTGAIATRSQVPGSTAFDGGEGIWYHNDTVYFAAKGENRIWALDTISNTLTILYDVTRCDDPVLTGMDNVTVSAAGDVLVAEDGGDMQIVALTPDGASVPLLQVTGQAQSEITGPAFSPDGSRLYFSSQRGVSGRSEDGITYEVMGPFIS